MIPAEYAIPAHLEALREVVERCPSPEGKKGVIVMAGACEAITPEEAHLLITAYQLETA